MQNLEKIGAAVLDTHAWVWMSAGAPEAVAAASFRGRCIVSAISAWEVSMLAQKGRLELAPDLDVWLSRNLTAPVEMEPISPAICIASCRLPEFHDDPADRLIVATAITHG
ncbi:MAG: type II toxin-antitoxin system VapC family toxin, partial [Verrucomicrobiota bacterium]